METSNTVASHPHHLNPQPYPTQQAIARLLARIEFAAMVAAPVCPHCNCVIRKGELVDSIGTAHLGASCVEDEMERARR
jgi:hypothetical protein